MPTNEEFDEHKSEVDREIEKDFPSRLRREHKTEKLEKRNYTFEIYANHRRAVSFPLFPLFGRSIEEQQSDRNDNRANDRRSTQLSVRLAL